MARPIKDTPALKGKYAAELLASMNANVPDPEKKAYLEECVEIYRQSVACDICGREGRAWAVWDKTNKKELRTCTVCVGVCTINEIHKNAAKNSRTFKIHIDDIEETKKKAKLAWAAKLI